MNCRSVGGIKTEIQKRIDEEETLLKAWKEVTFPVKKDGTPFKAMQKNIKGAKYCKETYTLQPGENELKVYIQSKLSGWVEDSISCYNQVERLDEKKKAKTENYMPKQTCLKQIYAYDLEDIKEAVANRIKYLEENLVTLHEQLEKVDELYNNFSKAYHEALKQLEEASGRDENSTLFYLIKDTVTNF